MVANLCNLDRRRWLTSPSSFTSAAVFRVEPFCSARCVKASSFSLQKRVRRQILTEFGNSIVSMALESVHPTETPDPFLLHAGGRQKETGSLAAPKRTGDLEISSGRIAGGPAA